MLLPPDPLFYEIKHALLRPNFAKRTDTAWQHHLMYFALQIHFHGLSSVSTACSTDRKTVMQLVPIMTIKCAGKTLITMHNKNGPSPHIFKAAFKTKWIIGLHKRNL